jgi:LytR cell envelope-related transcriptional attenuator
MPTAIAPISRRTRVAVTTGVVVAAAALTLGAAGCSSDAGVGTLDAVTTSSLTPLVTAAPTTSSTTSTSTTTSTTTTSTTLPPTTTTEPIITEGAIVLVANGSRVPGAAARLTSALADVGFTLNSPVNAAGSDEDLPDSRIYATNTNDPVALSIARLMGGVPVLRMPTPVPVETGSAADATVVVMLGKDRADQDLAVP